MGNVKGDFQEVVLMYKSQRFINHYLSLQAVSDGLFVIKCPAPQNRCPDFGVQITFFYLANARCKLCVQAVLNAASLAKSLYSSSSSRWRSLITSRKMAWKANSRV